jgi:hypothetical protein
MGIELTTYCPELRRNEHDADNGIASINPVGALGSPQRNETELDRLLDTLVPVNPRRERQIISRCPI